MLSKASPSLPHIPQFSSSSPWIRPILFHFLQFRFSLMAAEVHIIGQLESAYGFEPGDNRLCCRWALHFGGGWRVIEGDQEGQTQTDLPDTDRAYFAHPIDIHLATRTIQGKAGRRFCWKCGTTTGTVDTRCADTVSVWCRLLQGNTRLNAIVGALEAVFEMNCPIVLSAMAQLETVAAGTVELRLAVITRHFDRFGIVC
uniref:B9 domain-containing protein 2 n=1 Tax=Globodera rostochiensis TaxID=31243 RepID=A0A914I0S1_GLORO